MASRGSPPPADPHLRSLLPWGDRGVWFLFALYSYVCNQVWTPSCQTGLSEHSLNTSYSNDWSIFGHWKPFFKRLDKLPPSGLKPDPDLTLPRIVMNSIDVFKYKHYRLISVLHYSFSERGVARVREGSSYQIRWNSPSFLVNYTAIF